MPTALPLTFTLGLRLHNKLPSTLYIMSPMHLQIMKLLCPTVKEEMHLLLDFSLTVKAVTLIFISGRASAISSTK